MTKTLAIAIGDFAFKGSFLWKEILATKSVVAYLGSWSSAGGACPRDVISKSKVSVTK